MVVRLACVTRHSSQTRSFGGVVPVAEVGAHAYGARHDHQFRRFHDMSVLEILLGQVYDSMNI